MKTKRFMRIAVLALAVCSCLFLIGCGNSSEEQQDSAPTSVTEAETTDAAVKDVAEEEAQDLQIVKSGYNPVAGMETMVSYAMEVKNPNKGYKVDLLEVTTTAYDEAGNVIGTQKDLLHNIKPETTVFIAGMVYCDNANTSKVEFNINTPKEDYIKSDEKSAPAPFSVKQTEIYRDEISTGVKGTLVNEGDKKYTAVALPIIFYDSEDNIIFGLNDMISDVEPHSETPFKVELCMQFPEYDHYEVYPRAIGYE